MTLMLSKHFEGTVHLLSLVRHVLSIGHILLSMNGVLLHFY